MPTKTLVTGAAGFIGFHTALRLLEHGYKVRLVETVENVHAVDAPADLSIVEGLMRTDPLVRKYLPDVDSL